MFFFYFAHKVNIFSFALLFISEILHIDVDVFDITGHFSPPYDKVDRRVSEYIYSVFQTERKYSHTKAYRSIQGQ